MFIIRRFATSPRLVLTVATIALGQSSTASTFFLPRLYGYTPRPDDPTGLATYPASTPATPFGDWSFAWGPVVFRGAHVLTIVVAMLAMVLLAVFFRYTSAGVALRGAAENTSRAELLGISTNKLSSMVWVIAALLAATGGLLSMMVNDFSVRTAAGAQ